MPLLLQNAITIIGGNSEGELRRKGSERMELFRNKRGYIWDMEGAIYHGNGLLGGVKEFVKWV